MDFSGETDVKNELMLDSTTAPASDDDTSVNIIPMPSIMETFAKSQASGAVDVHLLDDCNPIEDQQFINIQAAIQCANSGLSDPDEILRGLRSDFAPELSEMTDSGAVQMIDDLKTVLEPGDRLPLSLVTMSSVLNMTGDESTLSSNFGQSQSMINKMEDDSRSSFDSFKAPLAPMCEASMMLISLPPEEDSQSSIKTQTPTPGSGSGRDTIAINEEDSQSSFTSQRSSKRRCLEVGDIDDHSRNSVHGFNAANLFEYQWPHGGGGEYFILQEQISEYLGVKSFKRKYPDLHRRQVDMDEKEFLKDRGVVTETQCDLGLTALRSEEVIDLMVRDYFDKYREYERILHEKEKQSISAKHRGYTAPTVDKNKMAEFVKKSVRSAAEWNSNLNRERQEERQACFDLQTNMVHYQSGKGYKLDKEATKVGLYPVALVPGQFQEYYRKFTPTELRYLPLNTVIYGPRPFRGVDMGSEGSPSDSDDSSSTDGTSSETTRDGSGDSSTCGENTANSQSDVGTAGNGRQSKTPKTLKKKKQTNKKSSTMSSSMKGGSGINLDRPPCRVCRRGMERLDKNGQSEEMIQCSLCRSAGHVSCLDFGPDVVAVIRTYPWQCMDCKKCMLCLDPNDEAKMMFCEKCDRGYHTFCVGLRNIPRGPWVCVACGKCALCGADRPGPESATKAQWHHEYVKKSGGKKVLKRTLCLSCTSNKSTPKNKPGVLLEISETPDGATSSAVAKVKPIRLQMRVKKVK